ncbi:hypothetical protein EBU60_07040, partial [bacterium]|nr:hypothetical protein [bacterium]
EPVAQNSAQLNIEFMAGTEWMNEMVMVLSGQAPEGTIDVAVVGQESEDFSASVNSAGQFAVWWPSTSGQVTGRVVARDAEGSELASLELADYYGDSGARQNAPPADGFGDGTDSDPTSEMPGGDMLDLEPPLPPVQGGDGTFEPAQITNVRVPDEVQAGTPLVIRFRMTDTSGYQAPVAFIGGPSGWVSNWCGDCEHTHQLVWRGCRRKHIQRVYVCNRRERHRLRRGLGRWTKRSSDKRRRTTLGF